MKTKLSAQHFFFPAWRLKQSAVSCLFVFCTFFNPQAIAQIQDVPQPAKDPAAIALVQRSLAAMNTSAGALQDSVSRGTLKYHGQQYPITFKTKGTTLIRVEVQKNNGTNIRIVNNGAGVFKPAAGPIRHLVAANTLAERVSHIPALSILAESQNANVGVQLKDVSATTGIGIVRLSLQINDRELKRLPDAGQCEFSIDSATGLVNKISFTNFSESDSPATANLEIVYSDYRVVSGIAVPFHQITYIDGVLDSEVLLDSVRFNVGVADTEFDLNLGGN